MLEVLRIRKKLFSIPAQKIAIRLCFRQNGTNPNRDLYHIGALEVGGAEARAYTLIAVAQSQSEWRQRTGPKVLGLCRLAAGGKQEMLP